MTKLNNTVAGTFAIVATLVTIAAATPLRAEPARVAVAYGDLDLSSAVGASQLDARIRRAAEDVCGRPDVGTSIEVAACRQKAVMGAKATLAQANPAADIRLAVR
jgi:UrcA family protein